MQPQKKMNKRSCLCSIRSWVIVIVLCVAFGLVVWTGWPLTLYNNYGSSSVKVQLGDEFHPRTHSHKHYHRNGQHVETANSGGGDLSVGNGEIQDDDDEASLGESSTEITDPKLREYKEKVLNAQEEAMQVLDSREGWTHTKGDDKETIGIVYFKSTKWGTVYKLEAVIEVEANKLFNDIIYNSEKVPEWNPTLLKVRVLQPIDDSTEVGYSVSATAVRGIVASRDFVYARHWEEEDGWLVTSSVSIDYPDMPENKDYVRGEQRPGVMRMKATSGTKTEIEWLLNSDIKGWLPKSIVNQALSGALVDYLANLRERAATLQ